MATTECSSPGEAMPNNPRAEAGRARDRAGAQASLRPLPPLAPNNASGEEPRQAIGTGVLTTIRRASYFLDVAALGPAQTSCRDYPEVCGEIGSAARS